MYKRVLILIVCIFLLTACSSKTIGDVELDDIYYGNNEYIEITSDYFKDTNPKNYVVFVHNTFCSLRVPCQNIFKEYMEKYNISFLSINIDEYKKTSLYDKVKYVPTVIVVNDNKIVAYLDAEKDEDLDKYQDIKEFESWINKYIKYNK